MPNEKTVFDFHPSPTKRFRNAYVDTTTGSPTYGKGISEYSNTEFFEKGAWEGFQGGWVNFPGVFDGAKVSKQEAAERTIAAKGKDSESGRKLNVFKTLPEALAAAKARSEGLHVAGKRAHNRAKASKKTKATTK